MEFIVGRPADTSENEAKRRIDSIKSLYRNQCDEQGVDYWKPISLTYARKIARGEQNPLIYNVSHMGKRDQYHASEDFFIFRQLQRVGVNLVADDPFALQRGEAVVKQLFQEQIDKAVAQAIRDVRSKYPELDEPPVVPDDPSTAELTTFHEALRQFRQYLLETSPKTEAGQLIDNRRKRRDQARWLIETHDDIPLWQLNKTECQKLVSYWGNRPETKKSKRCSNSHSKHMIACLTAFFEWCDESDLRWNKPKGKLDRTILKLPQDKKNNGFGQIGPETYKVHQLAQLAKAADNQGKLILGLSLNCAFGAAEIGRITAECFFSGVHPHAELLNLDSTPDDWFCYFRWNRPKSDVYGEWLLWEEVIPLVEWGIDRAKNVGQDRLILSKRNRPFYRDHAKNKQTSFANWFNALRKPFLSDDFPAHPFGTLRDTLPSILRHEYSQEISSVCLAHGETGSDSLIECYTSRPFGKLHTAIRELKGKFQPVLDELVVT
ncbi:hypothetical protein [Polystyrenella longa]|uniref:hypothetical protein n=1 Tax=Polystyrenella longa TaxID=2528007 RepID=UPI00119F5C17|nr:hypothetical protein [Polystyrenella longa]